MSDEEKGAGDLGIATAAAGVPAEQPYPDEHTTVPNPSERPAATAAAQAADGKWEMPKPKFQQTSGYLPQGYLTEMKHAAAATGPPSSDGAGDVAQAQAPFARPPASDGVPAVPPAIEPQPDL